MFGGFGFIVFIEDFGNDVVCRIVCWFFLLGNDEVV